MKNYYLFILVFITLNTVAQRRNIIKPLCFDWEYMDYIEDGRNENFSNVFNYKIGYERLIGLRVSVGISYVNFISAAKNGIEGNRYEGFYEPEQTDGYYYKGGAYTNKIRGFEYESRYFFNDLEKEGINSGYIGLAYSYLISNQSLNEVVFRKEDSQIEMTKQYEDKAVGIQRFGVKLGFASSGVLYSDVHLGIFYNQVSGDYNAGWYSPSQIYPVNVVLGWHIGLPF